MNNNNRIATDGVKAAAGKFATTTFMLVGKGTSNFVKDGTGGDTGVPAQKLTHGKAMMLPVQSRLFQGAGNGYRATQYVIGASTIYVEDYYEDTEGNLVLTPETPESAKSKGYNYRPGLKSQGYNMREEYARSMQLGICFEFGRMELSKFGDNPTLLRFVMEHEQNVEAPRAKDNKDRTRLHLFDFKPLVPEADAAKSDVIANFDEDFEAMKLVQALREQKNNAFVYNEAKMDAILSVLSEGVGLSKGDVVQKFKIIAGYAKRSGATFLSLVTAAFNEYKIAIGKAETLKVLSFSGKEAKLKDGTAMKSVFTFSKPDSKENSIEELIFHFMGSEEGRATYMEMKRQIDLAVMDQIK